MLEGKLCYNCMSLNHPEVKYCAVCGKEISDKPAQIHCLMPGTVIGGKYMVGNMLDEGGFGITYIGWDKNLQTKIAIKEFFPNGYVSRNNTIGSEVTIATDKQKEFFEKGKLRFLEEARSIAKFTSEPGIVDVRDYFEENGTAYIVMEYLDGVTLLNYVKSNGPFRADDLFRLMMPLMQSLQVINAHGVIHRDISPDNIMYLKNGTLKVMDFGSARYYTNREKEMSITIKQGYAPEEQYRSNGEQGPWTDVYGLCATIYRCITNTVPESGIDRLSQDTLPRPSSLGVSISPSLENVLMYGLAVRKENRCQNMQELLELTKRALNGDAINAYTPINNNRNVDSRTYGDSYSTYKTQDENYSDDDKENKKSSAGWIIALVVFIITMLIVLFAFVFPRTICANKGDATKQTSMSTTMSTVATTEKPSQTEPSTAKPTKATETKEKPTETVSPVPVDPADINQYHESNFTYANANTARADDGTKYEAINVLKHDRATSWAYDSSVVGTENSITLYTGEDKSVSKLYFLPGYYTDKNYDDDYVSRYENNKMPTNIRIVFYDEAGNELNQFEQNVPLRNYNRAIICTFSDFETCDNVDHIVVTVLDSEAISSNPSNDVCISYISYY